MTQGTTTMHQHEIEIAFTREELERLLHEVNNRACVYSLTGPSSSPWESIRVKLISAIQAARANATRTIVANDNTFITRA